MDEWTDVYLDKSLWQPRPSYREVFEAAERYGMGTLEIGGYRFQVIMTPDMPPNEIRLVNRDGTVALYALNVTTPQKEESDDNDV